jgi:colanic acid/amylovoran biosynthesis glycosyltransferase
MKVLVVCGGYPLASETFVRDQCTGLVEAGCDVEVLSLRIGDGTPFDGRETNLGLPTRTRRARLDRPLLARLLRVPDRFVRLFLQNPRAAWGSVAPKRGWRGCSGQLLEAAAALGFDGVPHRYDAIHCQFGPSGVMASQLRRAGVVEGPISVAFYGYDITREPRLRGPGLYRELFEDASVILPNSECLAGLLREAGAPPEKVVVHRLGIEVARFTEVDRSSRDPQAPWRAIAVGRFVEKKGFEFLIRAVAAAGDRAGPLEVTLIGDGPLRPGLERLASDLGVTDRVRFIGWLFREGMPQAMADADCMVAPSVTAADGDMEGLPLVIVEAMATGLPVIGTRHSGIPEAVLDGQNGVIVEERDVEGLADAIVAMADSSRRIRFGRRSRELACERFDHPELINMLLGRFRRATIDG